MRCRRSRFQVLGWALLGLVSQAGATTCIVQPDGSGDYPTIQDAVDHTPSEGTVLLAPGLFRGVGNRDVVLPLSPMTIRSLDEDATTCVICPGGAQSDPHRAFYVPDGMIGETCIKPMITECMFMENHAREAGGALDISDHADCADASAAEPDIPVVSDLRIESVTPNPFRASTQVTYTLPTVAAGRQVIAWDGCSQQGVRVAPGMYYGRLRAGSLESGRNLVIAR